MFGGRKAKLEKDRARQEKVAESQQTLLHAAVSTADMAQEVTRTMQRRMEDAVKQFVATARVMSDALLICDLNGVVHAYNPAAERLFGITGDGCTATTLFEYAGRPLVSADELWTQMKSKKRTVSGRHGDGSTFPIACTLSVLDRSNGSTLVLLVVQDMTFLTKALDSSFEGLAVISGEGKIVAVNAGVNRLYGFDCDDLLGRPGDVLMSSKDKAGNELDLIFEVARMQWEGQDAVLLTIKEVVLQKKAARSTKRDNGVDMIVTYDDSFRIISANQTFLKFFGLKKVDLVGTDMRRRFDSKEGKAFEQAIRAMTPERASHRSYMVSRPDEGDPVVHDWLDVGTFNAKGKLVKVTRTGRDIGGAVAATLLSKT
jgi:PAS domain S-box-containing protein